MTKKTSKKNLSAPQKVGIGIGLTAAAVAAAGAYFLHGSDEAPKNRKKVKSWMLKAKAEVLETLEDASEMSRDEYMNLINSVGATYGTVKNATKSDIVSFQKEMKEHWEDIEKSAKPIAKVSKKIQKSAKKTIAKVKKEVTKKVKPKAAKKKVKVAKKTAKKVAKKASKKTTKKK